jgi:hypothetical protein
LGDGGLKFFNALLSESAAMFNWLLPFNRSAKTTLFRSNLCPASLGVVDVAAHRRPADVAEWQTLRT